MDDQNEPVTQPERPRTRAEAEAQVWTLPTRYRYGGWFKFAHLIDGYAIAIEMGLGDLQEWGAKRYEEYYATGQWKVQSVTELRLLLFYKARQIRFSYELEYSVFRVVNSLLKEIARRTGQTYDDPEAEAFFAEEEKRWQALSVVERLQNLSRGVLGEWPVEDSTDQADDSEES